MVIAASRCENARVHVVYVFVLCVCVCMCDCLFMPKHFNVQLGICDNSWEDSRLDASYSKSTSAIV